MQRSEKNAPLFVLWDESHIWGFLLIHALKSTAIPFRLIRSREVRDGLLQRANPKGLLVPGGWAKLKSESLGSSGRKNILEYIYQGGNYLGFCGGAGLALTAPDHPKSTLGLCPCSRKPMSKRLPNFSGHVRSSIHPDQHFIKSETPEALSLPVWWPSQFLIDPSHPVSILAAYIEPDTDFWVADLDVGSLSHTQIKSWESIYNINLHPSAIQGEPCVVSGSYGQGNYLLSYSHLETPESGEANRLFAHIIHSITGVDIPKNFQAIPAWDLVENSSLWEDKSLMAAQDKVRSVLALGQDNFLLQWRTSWLLGWRRGIPGSSLNALFAYLREIVSLAPSQPAQHYWQNNQESFLAVLDNFCIRMSQFLLNERRSLAEQASSPEHSASGTLQKEREELVGSFPGYGGLYKKLIHMLDDLAWNQFAQ